MISCYVLIVQRILSMMEGKDMGGMMHEAMPKMMDGCFSKMDSEDCKGMLNMCHSMLAKIEAKYFGDDDHSGNTHDEEET
ncbi:hypothetical protein ACFLSG_00855 [Candidatus Bipolaricaulota bacterium]